MFPGPRERARRLSREFFSNPVLPMLGWTEAVKTTVSGGQVVVWIFYASVVTALWVFLDYIQDAAEDAVDEATDAVEEATD